MNELKFMRQMKRSRFDIIADILQVAKDGAKKTQVRYQCNLSHHQTDKFLTDLLETGLRARTSI